MKFNSFNKFFSIMLIMLLGVLVYSNSFICSFHFDDFPYIVENSSIRNIHNLLNIWNFYPCRFVTFLSFAVNYHIHQFNVFGYHFINLSVHLVSGVLVWWLVLLTLSTPVFKEDKINRHAGIIALFAGLVFVLHPIQTEAVTYVWQRTTSLATLFYLATLCLYAKSRLQQNNNSVPGLKRLYYVGSLITSLLAMFTKEMTITLPLMILLYEFSFFRTRENIKRTHLIPFLLFLLIIPLTITMLPSPVRTQEMEGVISGFKSITPVHYLLTQFEVILTYIKLVLLPFHQNLDYDFPVSKSIFELPTLFCLLCLAIILFIAKQLFSKYRLVSFSIFWFFLTLLPDSSIIPLEDLIFEHRLYLPLVGYSMFLVGSLYYLLGKNNIKMFVIVLIMIISCFSVLTYQRNKIWRDEITLWNDTVSKSPHKARPYNAIGHAYGKQGNLSQAIIDFNKAIELRPKYAQAYLNRSDVEIKQGDLVQAMSDVDQTIELNPDSAQAYNNRGIIDFKQGNFNEAMSDYNKAIAIKPDYAQCHANRGTLYGQEGDFTHAMLDFNKAIESDPSFEEGYYNRGVAYAREGKFPQAISDWGKVIDIKSNFKQAYADRAVVYFMLKEYDKAWEDVHKAQALGGDMDLRFITALKQVTGQDR